MSRALWLCWLSLAACSGESATQGLEQPVRVPGAQFHEGALPGLPPLSADDINAGAKPITPAVTSIDLSGLTLVAGEGEKSLRGRVSTDARAVALRFADLGDGYWLTPVGGPDPVNNGEYVWSLTANVARDVKPGYRSLLFAAIGDDGRSGNQTAVRFCIGSPIPDNLNGCEPDREPPAFVVSLAWDRDADVDLQVALPNGKLVSAKYPTTDLATEDDTPDATGPGVGVLDRDSNSACQIDGLRRENLVFAESPPPGTYRVYASLFQACGEASTRYRLSLVRRVDGPEAGTFGQVTTETRSGVLLATHADGGTSVGSFVTDFTIQ